MTEARFLLIDVGNTRTKWATVGRDIRFVGNVATTDITASWLKAFAGKFPNHRAILCCVVPPLALSFRRAFRMQLLEVSASTPELGFRFHYPKPGELGADRLAVAVAVHADGKFPAVIVSCGTATAFTVLDEKGRLCGGAIAPGLQAQLDALLGATSQLPATDLRLPRTALAKSTRDAIRAGVILGFRGGVKQITSELSRTFRTKPAIYLTGGNANLVAKDLGLRVKLRPLLVFQGLHIMGVRATP